MSLTCRAMRFLVGGDMRNAVTAKVIDDGVSFRRAMTLARFYIGLGFVLFGLVVAGCSSIGPGSVTRDRVDYAGAMSDSWKEQLLQNIVRLRYGDPPTFMDVSSVVSAYQIAVQASAGATANFGAPPNVANGTGALGVTGAYTDRPTISYTPLSGQKFAVSLLKPIPPAAIFSLIAAGYPADVTIPLTVSALNGVYNRTIQGGRQPADPEFYPLVEAFRRLQLSRSFSLRLEKRGAEDVAIVLLAPQVKPEVRQDLEFVVKTLKLKPEHGEVVLTGGAVQQGGNQLAVLSRSMLQILNQIASEIEAPAEQVSKGRTYANAEADPNSNPLDLPQILIHSGPTAPSDAYTAVRNRGSWYWIDDGDFKSKRAVAFLLLFFSLAESGVVPTAPVLTIPVQ